MYFWNARALAEDFVAKRVSRRERFKYLLAYMVLTEAALEISQYFAETISVLRIAESVAVVLVAAGGVIFCYQANQQGDGEEFVDRFICMGLPIGIRCLVLGLAAFPVFWVIGNAVAGDRPFSSFAVRPNVVGFMFSVILNIIYYMWVRSYILKISGAVELKPRTQ